MAETVTRRARNISRMVCGVIIVVVLWGDQTTKDLVERSVPENTLSPILPGFFNLTHVKNTGAAFGLLSDSPAAWKTGLLIAVSALLLVVVTTWLWRSRQLQWETHAGLALILGGALSNLIDRIRYGRVVDFLDFYIQRYHWPSFNLADTAIVIGASFLVLHILFAE